MTLLCPTGLPGLGTQDKVCGFFTLLLRSPCPLSKRQSNRMQFSAPFHGCPGWCCLPCSKRPASVQVRWCGPLSHQEVANPQSKSPQLGGHPEHAITRKSTCLPCGIKALCGLCGLANPGLSLTWLSRW